VKRKSQGVKVIIILFVSNFFFLSCNKFKDGIIESNHFDKKSDFKKSTNWYCKYYYYNDTIRKITFFNSKDDMVIKTDSVIYTNKKKYLMNVSSIIFDSVKLNIIKITFTKGRKIQRHFLVQKENKVHLVCVDIKKKMMFLRKRIDTNIHNIEFKSINDYLNKIEISENEQYYFSDFRNYRMYYKNRKLYTSMPHYFNGGITNDFPKEFDYNFNNEYLDLDKNDDLKYLMDKTSYSGN